MYAYCGNNPPVHVDSMGTWTASFGFSGNATFGIGVSGGIVVSIDDDGNVAVQKSYSWPTNSETTTVGCFDIGAASQLQVTNKDTVDDLEGTATYVGASAGFFKYFGFDIVGDGPAADTSTDLSGFQVSYGWGVGVDIHVAQTKTETVAKVNIWKWLGGLFDDIFKG